MDCFFALFEEISLFSAMWTIYNLAVIKMERVSCLEDAAAISIRGSEQR